MDTGKFRTQTQDDIATCQDIIADLFEKFQDRQPELIPILQTVQHKLGYLPETVLLEIARMTNLSPATVFGVATFYEQFRFHPSGRHTIRVCRGTACHVRGASQILSEIESRFQIVPGETTDDRLLTLQTVACFGSCALAPVVLVDDEVKGRMNPSKTLKTMEKIQKEMAETHTKPS